MNAAGNKEKWVRDLVRAAEELPYDTPDATRREAVRTSLLVEAEAVEQRGPRRTRWRVAGWTAVAAAAAVLVFVAVSARPGAEGLVDERVGAHGLQVEKPRRASIAASAQADFVHTATAVEDGAGRGSNSGSDEIVRLRSGKVTVAVEALRPNERFRVITSDAEVEVRGTSFDVEVEEDRLVAVRVHEGVVEVRLEDRAPLVLAAGEQWRVGETTAAVLVEDEAEPVAEPEPEPVAEPVAEPEPEPEPEPVAVTEPEPARVAVAVEPAPVPPPDATDEPERETSIEPEIAEAERLYAAGWTALRRGNYGDAARYFDRSLDAAEGPLAADARYGRAVALARSGRTKEAKEAMADYLARHAGSARAGEVAVMLGWIHLEAGERDQAMRRFRAAVDDPDDRVRASARAGLKAATD